MKQNAPNGDCNKNQHKPEEYRQNSHSRYCRNLFLHCRKGGNAEEREPAISAEMTDTLSYDGSEIITMKARQAKTQNSTH